MIYKYMKLYTFNIGRNKYIKQYRIVFIKLGKLIMLNAK